MGARLEDARGGADVSALFTTVMADPAWQYRDKLRMSKTKRSSEDQYRRTMTVDEICAMYAPSRIETQESFIGGVRHVIKHPGRLVGFDIADEGFLILWCTAAALLEGNAVRVCNAWGYVPTQLGVWIKGRTEIIYKDVYTSSAKPTAQLILQIGMGWALRNAVEFFIVGTRGKYTTLLKHKGEPNVLLAPEELIILADKREHSRKPDEMYDKVERTFPGPYLELFAKHRRDGWTQHGDELPALTLQVPDATNTTYDRVEPSPALDRLARRPLFSPSMIMTELADFGAGYETIYPDTEVEWP